MGCQTNVSILFKGEAARDLGSPMGELVSKRALGALGTLMPYRNPCTEDDHDARKPVSQCSCSEARKYTYMICQLATDQAQSSPPLP